MTLAKSRALLAALLLAAAPLAITAAHAQEDSRQTSDGGDGSRFQRPSQAKAQAANTLGSAVQRSLSNAQAQMAAKKWPDALAAAKEGLANSKTDYEKLTSNRILTSIDINMGDEAGAAAAAEAAADTPAASIPAEDKLAVYYTGAALALNAKHNDKAIVYAKALQALNPADPRMQDVIGRAYYASGDPAAVAYFQKQVDATIAGGKAPSRDALEMLMAAQFKNNNEAAAAKTMVQSILYYNDKKDWEQIIDVTMSTNGVRDIDAVMLGRLLFVCGANVSKENAQLIGETTQKMALYGDAQAAQAKGATLQLDPARVAADKASLPQQVQMAGGQDGLFSVKLAEAQYGYGMYADAEASARLALSKGGADASEAQLLIGMSQVMAGKYADGVASLGQVKGGGPVTPNVAELWITYAKIKGGLVPGAQSAAR